MTREEKRVQCDKNDKNEIKKQVIYLYVCYPPGLEDYSSRPGIVSRSSVVLSVEGVLSVEREERKMRGHIDLRAAWRPHKIFCLSFVKAGKREKEWWYSYE